MLYLRFELSTGEYFHDDHSQNVSVLSSGLRIINTGVELAVEIPIMIRSC
jgi:hypothetical protein